MLVVKRFVQLLSGDGLAVLLDGFDNFFNLLLDIFLHRYW